MRQEIKVCTFKESHKKAIESIYDSYTLETFIIIFICEHVLLYLKVLLFYYSNSL